MRGITFNLAAGALGCLFFVPPNSCFAQVAGDINIQWATPAEFLTGIERKIYPGEALALTVSGSITQHDQRTETHCKFLGMFCDEVKIPDPHSYPCDRLGPQIFVMGADGQPAPSPGGGFLQVQGGSAAFTLSKETPTEFNRPYRLLGLIPWSDRSRAAGACAAALTVTSQGRVAALHAYLAAGPRSVDTLRLPDVVNSRLRAQFPSQVANEIAAHAQQFFSAPGDPRADEFPTLLKFAIEINPDDTSLLQRLATYYVDHGDFDAAQQAAEKAWRLATTDRGKAAAAMAMGIVLERRSSGLGVGDLPSAAAFYEQAAALSRAGHQRSALIDALLSQARVLTRVHSKPALEGAVKALSDARDLTPVEIPGVLLDVSPDGSRLLLTNDDVGFGVQIVGGTEQVEFVGQPGELWLPVLRDEKGRVLVSHGAGGSYGLGEYGWWSSSSKDTLVPARLSGFYTSIQEGNGNLLARQADGPAIRLVGRDGTSRTVAEGLYVPLGAAPPDPSAVEKQVTALAVAAKADVIGWTRAHELHVETVVGKSLRTVKLSPNQWIEAIVLSANGAYVAALATEPAADKSPSQRLMLWSLTEEAGPSTSASLPASSTVALSFSPDSLSLFASVAEKLQVMRVKDLGVEKSLEISFGTDGTKTPTARHVWLDDSRLLLVPQRSANDTETPTRIVTWPKGQLSPVIKISLQGYGFGGGFLDPLPKPGQPTELLNIVPQRRTRLRILLAEDASEVGALALEGVSLSSQFRLVADNIIVRTDGRAVTIIDLSTGAKSAVQLLAPAQAITASPDGSWQILEGPMAGDLGRVSRFQATGRQDTVSLPPISKDFIKLYETGGACHAANWTPPSVPFVWQAARPWPPGAGAGRVLLPKALSFVPPGVPQGHELISIAALRVDKSPPGWLDQMEVVSCSWIFDVAEGRASIEGWSFLEGQTLYDRLVWIRGAGASGPKPLFSRVPRKPPPDAGKLFIGQFFFNSTMFVAGYTTPPGGDDTSALKLWEDLGSGNISPTPCSACDRFAPQAFNRALKVMNPLFVAPGSGLWLSPWRPIGGIPSGDALVIHDFAGNSILLEIEPQVPLFAGEALVLTASADTPNRILVWRY